MTDRGYRIQFQEWLDVVPGMDAQGARFVVREGEESRAISVLIAGPLMLALPVLAGRTTPKEAELGLRGEGAMEGLDDAFLRFGVARIEQMLRDRTSGADPLPLIIQIDEVDAEVLASLVDAKECRYQLEDAGELYCAAAAPNDETVIGSVGLRRLAPTSRPICGRCGMPDQRYLCSHLSHPEVWAIRATGGLHERQFAGALCELNQPGIETPEKCRAGGNACWELVVSDSQLGARVTNLPATALPEALDHLDVVWRLAFGKGDGLLHLRSAADTAGLAMSCSNREEFESRMSDLAEALDSLSVGDGLLPEDPAGEKRVGTINRIEACLRHHLPPDSFQPLASSISTLRAAVGVRVAFQHARAAQRLPEALNLLRVSYPPRDYELGWDSIRAQVVNALGAIRDALRRWTLE